MTTAIKTMLLTALELKLASVKRAQNTNRNPRFNEVYAAELADVQAAIAWVNAQKAA